MIYLDSTKATYPPMSPGSGAPGQYTFQRLAGVTTAEDHNSRALAKDRVHAIVVGSTPIRIEFRGEAGLGTQVDRAVSFRIPANTTFYFVPTGVRTLEDGTVQYGNTYVYASDDSGASGTWEAFIYQAGV